MEGLPSQLDLDNPEFQQVYRLLNQTSVNIFLTGKAGTGKSTFLKYICSKIKKKFIVLAPTGIAAINVGGVTIHSFFQMPLRPVPPDDPEYTVKSFIRTHRLSRQKQKLIRELDLIIIDEVSMVRADMIDFIDRVLRGVRGKRGLPFGGVQLLLVGDIFQLEPVVTPDSRTILSKYYSNFFFFSALAYKQVQLVAIELKKMYRQKDRKFIQLLDRVRLNSISDSDISLLNSRNNFEKDTDEINEDEFKIILASRRDTVTSINSERMSLLPGEERIYEGEIEDEFPEKLLPTDMLLSLKVDAQVMLIRNDRERRWVNGSLAKVLELEEDYVLVELENGRAERVEREIWENIVFTYDEKEKKVIEKVIGRFSQFPLKAAWALTIHKSQGLTFSNVTIDMEGGAFTAGQTYVALSRCRSLEGLRFVNPIKRYDVIVSSSAKEFSKKFNDERASERALNEAEVKRLSIEAKDAFSEGKIRKSVELVWKINNISGALASESVRRFISIILNTVNKLRNNSERQKKQLKKASKALSELGNHLSQFDNETSRARKAFEDSLNADESNTDAMIGLASLLENDKNYDSAQKYLKEVIKIKDNNTVKAIVMSGDIYAKQGDIDAAVSCYQSGIKRYKKNRLPVEHLINLYESLGNEELAIRWKEWLSEME